MVDHEKLVIMVTHGPDDPERATIPFVMAGAALASDVEVVMGFQADGVPAHRGGRRETIEAPEFPPLAEPHRRLPGARRHAPRLLALPQEPRHRRTRSSRASRSSPPARFVAEVTSATNTLVY